MSIKIRIRDEVRKMLDQDRLKIINEEDTKLTSDSFTLIKAQEIDNNMFNEDRIVRILVSECYRYYARRLLEDCGSVFKEKKCNDTGN